MSNVRISTLLKKVELELKTLEDVVNYSLTTLTVKQKVSLLARLQQTALLINNLFSSYTNVDKYLQTISTLMKKLENNE